MPSRPPRLSEWLLRRSLAPADREAVLGDLTEAFEVRRSKAGDRPARSWYRRQVRGSLLPNLRGRIAQRGVPPGTGRAVRVAPAWRRGLFQDLRDALRSLRASAGLTTVALVVLMLGIGASTAIFSIVDAVVLRSLPFDDADRLIVVSESRTDRIAGPVVSPQDYRDWVARQDVFDADGLAAMAETTNLTIRQGGPPEDLRVMHTTPNVFAVLHVPLEAGRMFSNGDGAQARVAVISDALWRRRFGADPAVVGTAVAFDDGSWTIVGVAPPGFSYPAGTTRPVDVWVPLAEFTGDDTVRGNHSNFYLNVIGRLKAGVSFDRARARMEQIAHDLAVAYPDWFKNRGLGFQTLSDSIIGADVRSWMWMLLGAVGVLLLIACVNVAHLMLARATVRRRDIGIRASLGATRGRLVRSLLVESLVLSLIGTGLGVLLAYWGVDVLRASLPGNIPRAANIAVNLRVLAAAACASVVTGVAFGLAPALQLSRPDLVRVLRGSRSDIGAAHQRARSALVVVEVALAVVLLVGAGLFMASFARVTSVSLGLDYSRVVEVPLYEKIDASTPASLQAGLARFQVTMDTVLRRVQNLPGVEAAAVFRGGLPLSGNTWRSSVKASGHDQYFGGEDSADIHMMTPDYLKVIGVPLVTGRLLTDTDNRAGAEPVALLNETAAKRYFDGRSALGETVMFYNATRTVVGVVRDVRLGGPEAAVRPEAYMPLAQGEVRAAYVVARMQGDPSTAVASVQRAVMAAAPDLPLSEAATFPQLLGRLIGQRRFNMLLLGAFGVLAVAIATIGIYGVVTYTVAQRRQEIGVRMALGAIPAGILRTVLIRASIGVAAGIAPGLCIAWWLARFVQAFLFQVPPHNFAVYGGVAGVLLAAGLVAAFVPARRAARVDPLVALRTE